MLKLLTLNRLVSLPDESLVGTIGSKMLRVLPTNADQFLNKRDLLSAQITGNHPPDIIIISEMLPKSPNSIISSALFACTSRIFSSFKF